MEKNQQLHLLFRLIIFIYLLYIIIAITFFHKDWFFIDGVNLLFHEAGHVIFSIFGYSIHLLGGSIIQLLIPAVCWINFQFFRQEQFNAAICSFWFAQNLTNIARYISDAPYQKLHLIGGVHDWATLFSIWGIIPLSKYIGGGVFILGVAVMVVSLVSMLIDLSHNNKSIDLSN